MGGASDGDLRLIAGLSAFTEEGPMLVDTSGEW